MRVALVVRVLRGDAKKKKKIRNRSEKRNSQSQRVGTRGGPPKGLN